MANSFTMFIPHSSYTNNNLNYLELCARFQLLHLLFPNTRAKVSKVIKGIEFTTEGYCLNLLLIKFVRHILNKVCNILEPARLPGGLNVYWNIHALKNK